MLLMRNSSANQLTLAKPQKITTNHLIHWSYYTSFEGYTIPGINMPNTHRRDSSRFSLAVYVVVPANTF